MIIRDTDRGIYLYESNGRKVEFPSIHRILAPIMDRTAPDYALNRGRLVHRACQILDSNEGGGLHWESLHPEIRPRVEAYVHFKDVTRFTIFKLIEEPLVSLKYRYGGTPDRFTTQRIVLEIKCGSPVGFEGIQLAAQAGLIMQKYSLRTEPVRRSVHLFPNGTWKMETWDDQSDWKVFCALLEINAWRIRHGRDRAD